MNQKLWSGLATTALVLAGLSLPSVGYAEQSRSQDATSDANVSLSGENSELNPSVPSASEPALSEPAFSEPALTDASTSPRSEDAVKVGEYQSQDEPEATTETIALIQPHEMQGRSAATVYVRDIPVLTFLGAPPTESIAANADSDIKLPSAESGSGAVVPTAAETLAEQSNDPTWRATSIAAQLNQLHRDRIDAAAITVHWDGEGERYVIKINDTELVEMNANTILPDTTRDPANDALQAANRLRRLLGNAPPLEDIAGRPQPQTELRSQDSQNIVQQTMRGIASWYGPGFNGNRSASGEIFNQNALTAAHRSLPFGTQVRVTNLRNGQSVVVRINDRGPFSGRRIIDLSAAAARAVGLIQAGVAPVSIDVLGTAGAIGSR